MLDFFRVLILKMKSLLLGLGGEVGGRGGQGGLEPKKPSWDVVLAFIVPVSILLPLGIWISDRESPHGTSN